MAPRGYSESLHEWNLTPAAAVEVQRRLRDQIRLENRLRDVRTIGGADISFNRFSKVVYAGLVVLALPELEIIDSLAIRTTVDFPYIPGLLSFREAPPLLEAWEKLSRRPDLLMLDGHGIAHPRRFGIASHLGLLLDLPTIGCAKTRLVGHYADPAPEPGSHSPLLHRVAGSSDEEVIGAVLRTRRNSTPIFVSPGHLIDLDTALHLVRQTITRYRQPEPTRQAHLLVNRLRRQESLAR